MPNDDFAEGLVALAELRAMDIVKVEMLAKGGTLPADEKELILLQYGILAGLTSMMETLRDLRMLTLPRE